MSSPRRRGSRTNDSLASSRNGDLPRRRGSRAHYSVRRPATADRRAGRDVPVFFLSSASLQTRNFEWGQKFADGIESVDSCWRLVLSLSVPVRVEPPRIVVQNKNDWLRREFGRHWISNANLRSEQIGRSVRGASLESKTGVCFWSYSRCTCYTAARRRDRCWSKW